MRRLRQAENCVNTHAWLITRACMRDSTADQNGDSGAAWLVGSLVEPPINAAAYDDAPAEAVRGVRASDLSLFSNRRGGPEHVIAPAAPEQLPAPVRHAGPSAIASTRKEPVTS